MGAVVLARQQFSTSTSHDAWSNSLQQVCGFYTTCLEPEIPFFGETELRAIDGLTIAYISVNAHAITRSRAQASLSEDEELFLIGCLAGSARMIQQQEDFILAAGGLALIDSGLPSEFVLAGPTQFLALGVPRKLFTKRTESYGRSSPTNIPGTGVGGLLLSLLVSTFQHAAMLSDADARAAEESLLALLRSSLSAPATVARLTDRSSGELYAVQQLILTMLRNPNLSPAVIAQRYGTSTRHLHRLFEATGCSLSTWIRRSRLERCRRDLIDPLLADEHITSIAFKWGFNEASHFSRTFRQQFGVSPHGYRHQAGGGQRAIA